MIDISRQRRLPGGGGGGGGGGLRRLRRLRLQPSVEDSRRPRSRREANNRRAIGVESNVNVLSKPWRFSGLSCDGQDTDGKQRGVTRCYLYSRGCPITR